MKATYVKIKKNSIVSIFFILLLLPYLEPLGFKEEFCGSDIIDTVYTAFKIAFFIGLLAYYMYQGKISRMFLCQATWAGILLFSTLNNGSGFAGFKMYAGPALAPLGVILVFDIFHKRLKDCVPILSRLFVVYCAINLITFIEQYYIVYQGNMPDGVGRYFFSIDNRFVFYFIPAIACALIVAYGKEKKMTVTLLFLMVHAEIMLVTLWSVGAMLAMTLIILWIIVIYRFTNPQLIHIKTYLLIIMIANLCLYIVAFVEPINLIFQFIADAWLQKGSNLEDRFVMWKRAMKLLASSPVLGVGIKEIEFNYLRFGVSHAHNLFMDIAFKGGVLSLISFGGVLVYALRPLYKYRNNILSRQLSFLVFISLVLSLVDTYSDSLFYTLLCLCYHMDVFLTEPVQ
ncbi:MAG: O-antigen ligase family protein [Hungatella sp.]